MLFNKTNKRGVAQLPAILSVAISVIIIFVVMGLILVYGADIEEDVRDDQTSGSIAEGVGNDSLLALKDISEKQDSLSSVSIAAIIIATLITAFGGLFIGTKLARG
jgi:predicted permease